MSNVKKIPKRMTAFVESIQTFGSLARAAKAVGVSEQAVYPWLRASKNQQARGDKSEPLFFEFMGESLYFHEHCQNAKSANVLGILYGAVEMARVGRTEPVYNPQTGYRLQKQAERFLGMTDAQIIDAVNEEDPFNPIEPNPARLRYEWAEDGSAIYEERQVAIPASLHSVILKGLLPQQFGDKISVSSESRISVQTMPAPQFVPPQQRLAPPLDVGELTVIPSAPTIDDIKAQRLKEAEEYLARPRTKATGPVNLGGVRGPEPLPPIHGDPDSGARRPDRAPEPVLRPPWEPPQPPSAAPASPKAAPQDHYTQEPGPMAQRPVYLRRPQTLDDIRKLHDAAPKSTARDPGARTDHSAPHRPGPTSGKVILK